MEDMTDFINNASVCQLTICDVPRITFFTKNHVQNGKLHQHYVEMFTDLFKDIHCATDKTADESSSLQNVLRFLNTDNILNKTDKFQRSFLNMDDKYLVNALFTQGVQCVEEGESHVYRCEGNPLDIYVANVPSAKYNLKSLLSCYESEFWRQRVCPNSLFQLPGGTFYFVLVPFGTFFRKHILTSFFNCIRPSALTQHSGQGEAFQASGMAVEWEKPLAFSYIKKPDELRSRDTLKYENDSLEVGMKFTESNKKLSNELKSEDYSNSHKNKEHLEAGISFMAGSTAKNKVLLSINANELLNSITANNLSEISLTSGRSELVQAQSVNSMWREDDSENQKRKGISNTPSGTPKRCRISRNRMPAEVHSNQPEVCASLASINLQQNYELTLSASAEIVESARPFDSTSHPAFFGIRKDSRIESYILCPESRFKLLPSPARLTGSFVIKNADMDPSELQYSANGDVLSEKAFFKDGSIFCTSLPANKDFIELLSGSTRRKEKVVVDYFFSSAFSKMEAIYNKFLEMRMTGMIGGCIPALVPMGECQFSGSLPDAYVLI